MKLIGAILVFVLICAVSALLFLASIPAVVHRTAPELDQTLLFLAGLLVLAAIWWFVSVVGMCAGRINANSVRESGIFNLLPKYCFGCR